MAQTRSAEGNQLSMDAIWADFLKTKVNSFIKWDLVRFFHNNPYTVDTADNIAACVARDTDTVRAEMDELVRAGILEASEKAQGFIYRLTTTPETRQLVENFIKACHDRNFRVEMINVIIKLGNLSPRYDF